VGICRDGCVWVVVPARGGGLVGVAVPEVDGAAGQAAFRDTVCAGRDLGEAMNFINWFRAWWITWEVWRNADAEQRRIMTEPFNPDDYIEVERP